MPMNLTVTSNVVYVRFHGLSGGAGHDYIPKELKPFAAHVRKQAEEGKTVYAFFNNDANVRAPYNAQLLMKMVEAGNEIEGPRPKQLHCRSW